jgi:hypothetical protein
MEEQYQIMKLVTRNIRSTSLHVCGIALLFLSLGIGISGVITLFDDSVDLTALFLSALILAVLGFILFTSTTVGDTDQASIFSAVGATWLVVSLLGTVPYLLAGTFDRAGIGAPEIFVDALFESVSGFSCTGSTVFGAHNLIELQGAGILFYPQQCPFPLSIELVVSKKVSQHPEAQSGYEHQKLLNPCKKNQKLIQKEHPRKFQALRFQLYQMFQPTNTARYPIVIPLTKWHRPH